MLSKPLFGWGPADESAFGGTATDKLAEPPNSSFIQLQKKVVTS